MVIVTYYAILCNNKQVYLLSMLSTTTDRQKCFKIKIFVRYNCCTSNVHNWTDIFALRFSVICVFTKKNKI